MMETLLRWQLQFRAWRWRLVEDYSRKRVKKAYEKRAAAERRLAFLYPKPWPEKLPVQGSLRGTMSSIAAADYLEDSDGNVIKDRDGNFERRGNPDAKRPVIEISEQKDAAALKTKRGRE